MAMKWDVRIPFSPPFTQQFPPLPLNGITLAVGDTLVYDNAKGEWILQPAAPKPEPAFTASLSAMAVKPVDIACSSCAAPNRFLVAGFCTPCRDLAQQVLALAKKFPKEWAALAVKIAADVHPEAYGGR